MNLKKVKNLFGLVLHFVHRGILVSSTRTDHHPYDSHKTEDVCLAITQLAQSKKKNTDDLIKNLYAMTFVDLDKLQFIAKVLTMLSLDVVNLIGGYLALDHKKDEANKCVQILGGSLKRNFYSGTYTDLNLFYRAPEKIKPHKALERMINGCKPDTAIIDSEECEIKSCIKTVVIKIKNNGLMNQQFFSRCNAALVMSSTKTEKPIFIDELMQFRKIRKLIAENKDYEKLPWTKDLIASLDSFINNIAHDAFFADIKFFISQLKNLQAYFQEISNEIFYNHSNLFMKEEFHADELDRKLTFQEIVSAIGSIRRSIESKLANKERFYVLARAT